MKGGRAGVTKQIVTIVHAVDVVWKCAEESEGGEEPPNLDSERAVL